MEKSTNFAIIKQKIIKTDQVLQLYVDKTNELKVIQTKFGQCRNEVDKLKLENDRLTFNLQALTKKHIPLNQELNELKTKHSELEKDYQSTVNSLQVKYQSVCEELSECKKVKQPKPCLRTSPRKDQKSLQVQIDKLTRDSDKLHKELEVKKKEIIKLKSENDNRKKICQECSKLTLSNYAYKKEITELKAVIDGMNVEETDSELKSKKKELEKLKVINKETASKFNEVSSKLEAVTRDNNKLVKENNQLTNEIHKFDKYQSELVLLRRRVEKNDNGTQTDIIEGQTINSKPNGRVDRRHSGHLNSLKQNQIQENEDFITNIFHEMRVPNILCPLSPCTVVDEVEFTYVKSECNGPIYPEITSTPFTLQTKKQVQSASGKFQVSDYDLNKCIETVNCGKIDNRERLRKKSRIKKKYNKINLFETLVALKQSNINFTISSDNLNICNLCSYSPNNTQPTTSTTVCSDNPKTFVLNLKCNISCCKSDTRMLLQKRNNSEKLLGFFDIKEETMTTKTQNNLVCLREAGKKSRVTPRRLTNDKVLNSLASLVSKKLKQNNHKKKKVKRKVYKSLACDNYLQENSQNTNEIAECTNSFENSIHLSSRTRTTSSPIRTEMETDVKRIRLETSQEISLRSEDTTSDLSREVVNEPLTTLHDDVMEDESNNSKRKEKIKVVASKRKLNYKKQISILRSTKRKTSNMNKIFSCTENSIDSSYSGVVTKKRIAHFPKIVPVNNCHQELNSAQLKPVIDSSNEKSSHSVQLEVDKISELDHFDCPQSPDDLSYQQIQTQPKIILLDSSYSGVMTRKRIAHLPKTISVNKCHQELNLAQIKPVIDSSNEKSSHSFQLELDKVSELDHFDCPQSPDDLSYQQIQTQPKIIPLDSCVRDSGVVESNSMQNKVIPSEVSVEVKEVIGNFMQNKILPSEISFGNSIENVIIPSENSSKEVNAVGSCMQNDFNSKNEIDKGPVEVVDTSEKTKNQLKMPRSKVKVLLEKLINYSKEEEVLNDIANQFMNETPEYIAELILDKVSMDFDKPDNKYSPAPIMTETQRTLLGFMSKLEKTNIQFIYDNYLNLAENKLVTSNSLKEIEPITRLYLAICKLRGDLVRMRRLCCDVFYFSGDLAIPFFFIVLTSWSEILPFEIASQDFPLAKVLVQIVHLKTCNEPGYNLMPLNDLLVKFYGYPIERWNSDEIFQELFEHYIRNPVRSADYAILLFCKNSPDKFVNQKIQDCFKPMIDKVNSENFKATIIILIGNLSFQLSTQYVNEIREWLTNLITDSTSDIVRQSVQLSLKRLKKR